MYEISDEQFDKLITRAMDELPQEYITGLNNVVITMADTPTSEQVEKMKLRDGAILLGLYEGVPLTRRGSGWSGMLPDRITLFKHSILQVVGSDRQLFEQIKRTLWHEIAHYYGLSHGDMHQRQRKDLPRDQVTSQLKEQTMSWQKIVFIIMLAILAIIIYAFLTQ